MANQNEQIFLELIQQHKGIIYKVSRMYMDSPEDREDLVQEILLRLWNNNQSFEGKSSFSTWMYRVAMNTAITFLRKEKAKPEIVSDSNAALLNKADENDNVAEKQLDIFYKAAKALHPIEKALIFYFMEGMSHREIGGLLGITENNARVKLNRTKEKLQNIIKTLGYEFT